MKTLFLKNEFLYDGTQLRPLYAYLEHKVLGNSVVSWVGPCQISFQHMVDGEDLLAQETIAGSKMLHFIVEIFERDLFSAVCLQRLFAAIVRDYLQGKVSGDISRQGDDLYWQGGKLSISIASKSTVSSLIHFAMNISNEGTPVKTCSLEDMKLSPEKVAQDIMSLFAQEYLSILEATCKVRPLV
ncbi:MAG: DUF366 family protein [Bdellovibrionia bacterium]